MSGQSPERGRAGSGRRKMHGHGTFPIGKGLDHPRIEGDAVFEQRSFGRGGSRSEPQAKRLRLSWQAVCGLVDTVLPVAKIEGSFLLSIMLLIASRSRWLFSRPPRGCRRGFGQ